MPPAPAARATATCSRTASAGRWIRRKPSKLQRGDLIFWKGHVAIARDAATIVHANAHHMATVIENTRDAIARIKAAGSEITCDQAARLTGAQTAAAPLGAASSRNAAANSARV